MKIHGKKLDGPNVAVLVLPRQDEDIVFKAQAVLSYDDFDAICPIPQPPEILRPGGERSKNVNDKEYQDKLTEWGKLKMSWMILKSLEATEGLEWETIDFSNPDTWNNFQTELRESGLSAPDVTRIVNLVIDVNGLNQDKIDEATKRFLATERQQGRENSQKDGQ